MNAQTPQRSNGGRIAAAVTAGITGLIALALLAGGSTVLVANSVLKDSDGYLSTGTERFSTDAHAITVNDLDLDVDTDAPDFLVTRDDYGKIRLRVTSQSGKPVFVGIAPTNEVNAYLNGVATDEVEDVEFDPFRADYRAHSGVRSPALPAEQRIWDASAQGDGTQTLNWSVKDGNWSVVVMNADGSEGVAAGVKAGAKLPFLSEIGFGTLGIGLIFLAATAVLIVVAVRPPGGRGGSPSGVVVTPAAA